MDIDAQHVITALRRQVADLAWKLAVAEAENIQRQVDQEADTDG